MQFPDKEGFTYADYLTWDDGKRYELIDGRVYMMSPAPSRIHQRVSGALFYQFYDYLRQKTCEVYASPFDVRLKDNTVLQPDITVVCDPGKLDERGCKGAPDLVVEILSPSTAQHDQIRKFNQYLEAGVREYWLVYPDTKTVQVNSLRDGRYVNQGYYGETDTIDVGVLEGCQIQLADVFSEAPEETAE